MPTSSSTPWTSSAPPEPGPDDHVRGEGPVVIEYADLECPYCAGAHLILKELPITRVFRHFPVVSKHPRARALAAAAEAAALQGRFWEMHDSLLEDQGHLDDPHLWQRARSLGLDLERFEADRRSAPVVERVERDFRSGIRAGITTTPTQFVDGVAHPGVPSAELLERLR
ncbi:MAG: DsbA family protein [Thermoleophilaceae bacterium]|nr:DsbA family protein [Thermoleophilaceae bacterium]